VDTGVDLFKAVAGQNIGMWAEMLIYECLPSKGVFEAFRKRGPDLTVFPDLMALENRFLVGAGYERRRSRADNRSPHREAEEGVFIRNYCRLLDIEIRLLSTRFPRRRVALDIPFDSLQ